MSDKSKLENLRVLARRARIDQENDDSAIDFYDRMLVEDPDDWEAYFYSNSFKTVKRLLDVDFDILAGSSSVDYYATILDTASNLADSFKNHLDFTMMLIKDHVDKAKQDEVLTEVLKELFRMLGCSMSAPSFINYILYSDMGENNYEPVGGQMVLSPYIEKVFDKFMKLIKSFSEQSLVLLDNEDMMAKGYVNIYSFSSIYDDNPMKPHFTYGADSTLDGWKEAAKNGVKSLIRKKADEYWATNADKKQQLIDQKNNLMAEKKQLESELEAKGTKKLDAAAESLTAISSRISGYKNEYSKLGLFKRKEKELLQSKINEANDELEKAKKTVEDLRSVIDPVKNKMDSVCVKIENIDKELSGVEEKIWDDLYNKYKE